MTISAASVFFTEPLMRHVICPISESISSSMTDKLCSELIASVSTAQVALTTYYTVDSIAKIGIFTANALYVNPNGPLSFAEETLFNAYQFVFPAGLGAYDVQSMVYNAAPACGLFLISAAKSSFEMTGGNAVARVVFERDPNEKSLLNFKHPAISGGIAAINVAKATNVYFYTLKALFEGKPLDLQLSQEADAYAFGYAIARPFYQVGMVANDANQLNMPMVGTGLYFAAPVCRGYILGLSGKGSINVPGKNISLASNVLDGIAIASVSMFNTYLDQAHKLSNGKLAVDKAGYLAHMLKPAIDYMPQIKTALDKFGSGPIVAFMLVSAEAGHKGYDAFSDYIDIAGNETDSREL